MTIVKLTDNQLKFFNGRLDEHIEKGNHRCAEYFCEGSSYSLKEEPLYLSDRTAACHSWVVSAFNIIGNVRCFGNTDYSSGKVVPSFVTLDAGPQEHLSCSIESHIHLLNWLSEESFAKDWILNKDDKESLYKKGVMLLCGKDGATCSEAMWICKVLRHRFEGGGSIDTWSQLVKRGVKPNVALLVCSKFSSFDFGNSKVTFNQVSGHVSVFFNNGLNPNIKDGFIRGVHNRHSCRTSTFFGAGDKSLNLNPLIKPLESSYKDDGWGGKTEISSGNIDSLAERCLEWEKKLTLNN